MDKIQQASYNINMSALPKCVVVFSGGLDSTCLLYSTLGEYDTHAITFAYGQRHKKEVDCAIDICNIIKVPHKILHLTFFSELVAGSTSLTDSSVKLQSITEVQGEPQNNQYVPNRNMMMLSIAASYAEAIGAEVIFTGFQSTDEYAYWDTTTQFRDAFNAVLCQNRMNSIRVEAPFVDMNKSDIIRLGDRLGVPFDKTWTCYAGRDKSCGKCPTCADRLKHFISCGVRDPLEYEVDIPWDKYVRNNNS